jgi:hypothetical protein
MQRPKRSAKMRMSMRQPATGSGCRNEIAASAQLDAWAPACIRIGWISSSRLTRECITDVVSRTHPSFEVTTFNSSSACLSLLPKPLDLIVYHLRGQGVADLQELAELRKAPAGVKLVVLSDSASIARSLIQRDQQQPGFDSFRDTACEFWRKLRLTRVLPDRSPVQASAGGAGRAGGAANHTA